MPEAEDIVEGIDAISYRPSFGSSRSRPYGGQPLSSIGTGSCSRVIISGGIGDQWNWAPSAISLGRRCIAPIDRDVDVPYPFEWVLAGHGGRIHLPHAHMQMALRALVRRRRGTPAIRRSCLLRCVPVSSWSCSAWPSPASPVPDKDQLLIAAAERNDVESVKRLLRDGAGVPGS